MIESRTSPWFARHGLLILGCILAWIGPWAMMVPVIVNAGWELVPWPVMGLAYIVGTAAFVILGAICMVRYWRRTIRNNGWIARRKPSSRREELLALIGMVVLIGLVSWVATPWLFELLPFVHRITL